MNNKELEIIMRIKNLCEKSGLDLINYLADMEVELRKRVKEFLTPNSKWFQEGKSIDKYWKFLEEITGLEWEYNDVEFWYKLLRGPQESREEITPSLRYKVLTRDFSTCQKCGRKAPQIELEIDHILPWNCGGPTTIDNLQTLCIDCNLGKSDNCFERGS